MFIIALRTGRLGNRLILFANFIAHAEEHGHRVANVTFHSFADLFETTRRDVYCRYPVAQRRSVFDLLPGAAPLIRKLRIFTNLVRQASKLNHKLHPFGRKVVALQEIPDRQVTLLDDPEVGRQLADAKVVFAYGWRFRAPDAVQRHAEKIRAYFRPIESVENQVRATMERLRQRAEVVVGVHVRWGDYRHYKQGSLFFEIPRYVAWMREVAAQFPGRKVAFFVCSDEPRSQAEFEGLTVEIGSGPPVTDLCTLARCDFIFGPVSTFSQWASFYGNAPLLFLRGSDDHVEMGKFRVSFLEEIP